MQPVEISESMQSAASMVIIQLPGCFSGLGGSTAGGDSNSDGDNSLGGKGGGSSFTSSLSNFCI